MVRPNAPQFPPKHMVDGVSVEEDCQMHGCSNVAYIQFDLDYAKRWFCFRHAVEMFELWHDHENLEITEFPDPSFFECPGYPAELSMLATVYKHGESE